MCCEKPLGSTSQVRRKNGWACPWHCQQATAWLLIIIVGVVYFTTVPPGFPPIYGQLPCYIVVGVCMFLMIVFMIIATSIDPADPLTQRRQVNSETPIFDRSKHSHVIENYFCNICNTIVDPTSKHCSVCNKCVVNFDHHCRWLNNCVGAVNYHYFILLIVFSLASSVFVLASTLLQFVAYFTQQPSEDSILQQFRDYYSSVYASNNASATPQASDAQFAVIYISCVYYVWLIIIGLICVVSLICIGLLLHLLCFHVYLCHKRITTYAYIRHQRALEESRLKGESPTHSQTSASQFAVGGNPCCPQMRVHDTPVHSNGNGSSTSASASTSAGKNAVVNKSPSRNADGVDVGCADDRSVMSRVSFSSAATREQRANGVDTNDSAPILNDSARKKQSRLANRPQQQPKQQQQQQQTATIGGYTPRGYNIPTNEDTRDSLQRLEVRLSRPVAVQNLSEAAETPRQSNLSVLPPVSSGGFDRGRKAKGRTASITATAALEKADDEKSEASLQEIPIAEFQRSRQLNGYNGLGTLSKVTPRGDARQAFTNAGYSSYLEV